MKKLSIFASIIIASLTVSAYTFAQNLNTRVNVQSSITALQALNAAQQSNSSNYQSIELHKGKADEWVYFLKIDSGSADDFILISATTGQDVTTSYLTSKYSLTDAIDYVTKSFEGKVIRAEKDHTYTLSGAYVISLQDNNGIKKFVIDVNSLQAIELTAHDYRNHIKHGRLHNTQNELNYPEYNQRNNGHHLNRRQHVRNEHSNNTLHNGFSFFSSSHHNAIRNSSDR